MSRKFDCTNPVTITDQMKARVALIHSQEHDVLPCHGLSWDKGRASDLNQVVFFWVITPCIVYLPHHYTGP